ncbi:glycosyltransferase family 2 protein [Pedobacter sp.]
MRELEYKVSVCMATYNGEKYILPQLKSILSQLSKDDEVIISDDCSTDHTLEMIKSLNDSRIVISSGKRFANPIFNFENALRQATGNYIFLSDQDDIWEDHKVYTLINEMKKGADLVISDCKIVDENLELVHPSYFQFNGSRPGILKNIIKNSYMGCCMAFTKKLLEECLPFPSYLPMHDSYLGLTAEMKFKVSFVNEALILHRKHQGNASASAIGKSKFSVFQKISFRINLLKALIKC